MSCVPIILVSAAISLGCAVSAFAEGDPAAAADLATIRQKAEATPGTAQSVDKVVRMLGLGQQQTDPDIVLRIIFGPGIKPPSDFPLKVSVIEERPVANARAQYLSQILSADLNNDWSVTREELTDALTVQYGRFDTASLFLLGDKDDDNILTLDEIRAVVTERAASDQFNSRARLPPNLFDFDNDGLLSRAELDRGLTALSQ